MWRNTLKYRYDFLIAVKPQDIYRKFHVLHPEAILIRFIKNKNHSGISAQIGASAQPLLSVSVSLCYFKSYSRLSCHKLRALFWTCFFKGHLILGNFLIILFYDEPTKSQDNKK